MAGCRWRHRSRRRAGQSPCSKVPAPDWAGWRCTGAAGPRNDARRRPERPGVIRLREALFQIGTVPLNAGTQSPEVHAIGANANGTAPPTGPERQNLVKPVQQAGPQPALDQPFDLRRYGANSASVSHCRRNPSAASLKTHRRQPSGSLPPPAQEAPLGSTPDSPGCGTIPTCPR